MKKFLDKILLVVVCLLVYGESIQFTNLPKDQMILELGKQVLLPCSVSGSPAPKVTNWLKDNKPVNFNVNFLLASGTLRIDKTTKEDSGDYQCVASNVNGGVMSEKRKVIVAYFERFTSSRETISKKIRQSFSAEPPQVDCQPEPKYSWTKNNAPVVETKRLSLSAKGGLYISNLESGDAGTYRLYAENSFLKSKSTQFARQLVKEITLGVYEFAQSNSAKVIYTSGKQVAGEKKTSSVTLECFVSGLPLDQITITWKKVNKDGRPVVLQNSRYLRKSDGRRLEIKEPTYEADNGAFQCVVEKGLNTQDTRNIELDVFSPATFSVKPVKQDVYTDNTTLINCKSSAYPSKLNRWYRNGIPVQYNSKYQLLSNNSLLIKSLNWEDNGKFQCAAENAAGLKFVEAEIKVLNKSASIISPFKNLYVGFGKDFYAPCVAVGAPKPEVYWVVNSTRISVPSPKYDVTSNGSLLIKNTELGDYGRYACVANNKINTERKSMYIYVIDITKIIRRPEPETQAHKGSDKNIPCEVQHDKRINYTREWRENNLPVTNKRYVVNQDGSLTIKFVQQYDTGKDFSCHVFSHGGNETASTTIILVEFPLEPSSPRASEIQAYAMRLIWDAPADGGSPLTEYYLYMKNYTMADFILLIKLPANATIYTVNHLQAGTRYKFKVAAANQFGTGDTSPETKWIETLTLAPSAAPNKFKSVASSKDSVSLAWMIPPASTHNGQLQGFFIDYRVSGTSGDFGRFDVKGGKETSFVINGLPLSTRYEVKIAAYNKAGIGPWSDTQYVETKQGTPSAPPTNVRVFVINDTAVSVNFTSPPQKLWNGRLTRIVARYWPPDRVEDHKSYETGYDPSSLHHQSFVLPNLKADTEYVLAVAVKTTGGESGGSSKVQFKTTEGVPDAVQNIQIAGIYSDAFSVLWTPPKESAGQLKGYKVKYRLYGTDDKFWNYLKDEPATALGAVVTPLQPRTRYEVQVAAFTSKGTGSFVGASVETIESPELPSAPSDLKAYAIWGNNISFGWTPGDSGRAVILYYVIEYNNDTAYHIQPERAVWRTIRNLTKILENPANLTNLRPSTTYRFRMTAYNRVGASPVSNVSEDITTSEGVPSLPPTNIRVTSPDRETLFISWTPPSKESWNSGSIKYQFHIKPKGQDEKIKTRYYEYEATQATSYKAKSLKKFTLYNITMRLFNDKGHGPWSKPVFARTSEDYPVGAPTNVQVNALSSDSVRVTWGPVPEDQRNGVIMGYKVYYQIRGIPTTELSKRFDGNTTFEGVITGLAGFTDYEIRLLAFTKVGGTFKGSAVVVKTREGKPGKPRDIRFTEVSHDFVNLEWNIPARPNGNIIKYEVRYKINRTGGSWNVHEDNIQPYARSARVYGLVFNAYYDFEIRAKTVIGWGEYARERVLIVTDRQIPLTPIILTIPFTDVHSDSIVVKWAPRYDGRSAIRAYNLEYKKEKDGWKKYEYGIPPVNNIPSDINELKVLRLEPGQGYQFRIRAVNDVGASAWSEYSEMRRTKAQVPKGAPSNIRVTKKTQTSLFISWEPPEYTGSTGKLDGYKVSYKLVGGLTPEKRISKLAGQTSVEISNLKVFSEYEVTLSAIDSQGGEVSTQPFNWRTGEAAPLAPPTKVNVVLQGSSNVRVTWEPPSVESVRGYNLGYKIESVRPNYPSRKRRSLDYNPLYHSRRRRALTVICPETPKVQTHLAGPHSTDVTLKNLLKYTQYEITVRVYNSFADGPKSEVKKFTTSQDVPSAPYILSERVYTNIFDLDFDTPCEPNGRITGFKIEYRERAGTKIASIEYVSSTRRIRISNLKPNTGYFLQLSAKNAMGFGEKAAIDFYTKGTPSPPKQPGSPSVYSNEPGLLRLQWDELDHGNMPVDTFYLQYRIGSGNWEDFRTIRASEVRYDGSTVVYTVIGLKSEESYRFRVKTETTMGTSPFSVSSKPITAIGKVGGDEPFYKAIWFIFLMVIIALILLIILVVCCYRNRNKKGKYKQVNKPYNMSQFEMAMVQDNEPRIPGSRNGSLAPSVTSSKKPLLKSGSHSASKSYRSEDARSYDGFDERNRSNNRDTDSIAIHYSHDPYHKNWRDSMDHKTKKAILAEYGRRPPSRESIDTLGEKKRSDSEELLSKPRPRPGRRDITERKKIARSEPFLDQPPDPRPSQPQTRRPGKKNIDQELTRSVPDLNYRSGPVTRQPSFLRATTVESDTESLGEVLDRQKSKHELAMEYDNRIDNFYPHAPPPYDYNGAPPAYSPSQEDDMSDGGGSVDYPFKNRPYNPRPRLSDNSDSSGYNRQPSRSYQPPNRGYRPPSRGNNSQQDYPPPTKPKPSYIPPPARPTYNKEPVQRRISHDTPSHDEYDGFAPPQISKFDDEHYDDDIDGYEADQTLV